MINGKCYDERLNINFEYIVCFDTESTIMRNEETKDKMLRTKGLSWKLGSCTSTKNIGKRDLANILTKRCCLEPGEFILSCHSKVPHGWNGGYMDFQGDRYCNDFTGYIGMYRVIVKGKSKNNKFLDVVVIYKIVTGIYNVIYSLFSYYRM